MILAPAKPDITGAAEVALGREARDERDVEHDEAFRLLAGVLWAVSLISQ
jgi:hypothetical protein